MVGVEVKAVLIRFNLFYGEIPYFFSIPQVDCVLINKKNRTLFPRMQIGFPLFRYKYNDIRGLKGSGTIIKECVGSGGQFFFNVFFTCPVSHQNLTFYHGHLFMGTSAINSHG